MSSSTTYVPASCARYEARGLSAGAQGADGVPELAASAYAALLAAPWEPSEDPPSIPTHAYDRPAPAGDAFKAVYGYEKEETGTGTERSAAGAVCYSFAMPADALDQTGTAGACHAASVSAPVTGDRYLALGARLRAVFSDSPLPPPVTTLLAGPDAAASAVVCATDGQTGTDGAALTPPYRTGVVETATCEFPSATVPKAYLHLALFLEDYHGCRGAWIEGGAMLDPRRVAVVFDRAVDVPDGEDPATEALAPLSLGASETQAALHTARASGATVFAWRTAAQGDDATPVWASGATGAEKAARALSVLLQGHAYAATDPEAAGEAWQNWCAAAFEGDYPPGITESAYCAAWQLRSGVVPAGTYTHLRLGGAASMELPCACRLYVFAQTGATASGPGEAPFTAPGPSELLTPEAVNGRLEAVRCGAATLRRVARLDLPAGAYAGGDIALSSAVTISGGGPGLVTALVALVPLGWGGGADAAVGTVPAMSFSYDPQVIASEDMRCVFTPSDNYSSLSTNASGVHAALPYTKLVTRSGAAIVSARYFPPERFESDGATLDVPGFTMTADGASEAVFIQRGTFGETSNGSGHFSGVAYYTVRNSDFSVKVPAIYTAPGATFGVPLSVAVSRVGTYDICATLLVSPAETEFAITELSAAHLPITLTSPARRAILTLSPATGASAVATGEWSLVGRKSN